MGKEIWLPMHVRNLGSDKIIRKFVRLHLLARDPKAFIALLCSK